VSRLLSYIKARFRRGRKEEDFSEELQVRHSIKNLFLSHTSLLFDLSKGSPGLDGPAYLTPRVPYLLRPVLEKFISA
jgi:hypothetical protein